MKDLKNLKIIFLICLIGFYGCSTDDDGSVEEEQPIIPEVQSEASESEASVTFTSIQIKGRVNPVSGKDILSYGVVWATHPNPTIEDNIIEEGGTQRSASKAKSGTNKQSEIEFTTTINDLEPNTDHYFKVYATNEAGTGYGEEISLRTLGLAGTKWVFTFIHSESNSWVGHVEFFEDGRAFYTEPEDGDHSNFWGTWQLDGNNLTYNINPNNDGYIATGEVTESSMAGSYSFSGTDGTILTWSAVPYSSTEEEEEEEEEETENDWWEDLEDPLKIYFNELLENGAVTTEPTEEEIVELLSATSLDIRGLGITNLEVINEFEHLVVLLASENKLNSLDVTALHDLEVLDVGNNELTSLTVAGLSNLVTLHAQLNQLSSLDLSGLEKLTTLRCSNNELTSLDLTDLTLLETLYCTNNELTSLEFSGLENLKEAFIFVNQLTTLDVSGLTNLAILEAHTNNFTSLDLSTLSSLEHLGLEANPLTTLNVTGLENLRILGLRGSSLTSLDLSGLINLASLSAADNQLESVDASDAVNISEVFVQNNQFTFSSMESLMHAIPETVENFVWTCDNASSSNGPYNSYEGSDCHKLNQLFNVKFNGEGDSGENGNGENAGITWWEDIEEPLKFHFNILLGNGEVTTKPTSAEFQALLSLTSLDLSGLGLTQLDVINEFEELRVLNVSENSLQTLDISELSNLNVLEAQINQLSTITFPAGENLQQIYLGTNQLTSLDLSGLQNLVVLNAGNNMLSSINVSGLSSLSELFLPNNELTTLDLTGLSTLHRLSIFNNDIGSLNVNHLAALTDINAHSNNLTGLDVSGLSNLAALQLSKNNLSSINLSGNESLWFLDLGDNNLTSIDASDLISLEGLYISNNALGSLDVSNSPELETIIAINNQISSIDLDGLTKLTELNLGGNNLSSMSVGDLVSLQTFWVQSNKFSYSSMKSIMESLPSTIQDFRWSCDEMNDSECTGLMELYEQLFE